MKKTSLFACLSLLGMPLTVAAVPFLELVPVSYYGWLDQYSITDQGFVGREACVPTSSTNALTFMQNINPTIFGSQLSGTTYQDWENTDDALIAIMQTSSGNGTTYDKFVWGLQTYVALMEDFAQVQFSGIFPDSTWTQEFPKPTYITHGLPTITFLSNALGAGSAVLVSIEYNDGFTGGGHELLFNGLSWDPDTNTGIAYFIDPLDPSQNYSPAEPTGPVKQTTGILSLNSDGSIELQYNQYTDQLPYTGQYLFLNAKLTGVLSVGGSFYARLADYQGNDNASAIIEGFAQLDPTTAAMFPILAVLNTTASLEDAFDQFDPSIYNNLIFSEESVAHQLQTVLNNHLLQYRNPACCDSFDHCLQIWATTYENCIDQHGGHYAANTGYKNSIGGGVVGFDFLPYSNLVAGVGLSYSHTDVRWNSVHAKSDIDSYGAIFYSALMCEPWWLDASFEAIYNKADGHRKIFITSAIPFISPIQETIHHKNHANVYAGHVGVSYDLCTWEEVKIWPYLHEDYIHVNQSGIGEHGGGLLDLKIRKKSSNYVRSELGIGLSYNFCDCAFLHTKFSYANEARFGGKKTIAYFDDTPSSEFSVSGSLPQNNLFCATILLGSSSVCETVKINLAYHGEFGKHLVSNEISAEMSFSF